MKFPEFLRGIFFSILMIYGSYCLTLIIFPCLLLIVIPSKRIIKLRRIFVSKCCGIYLKFAYFLIEFICNSKVNIYCNDNLILNEKESVLILSNHRTRIDWVYVGWCYGSFISVISNMIIILKDALRTAPLFGWLMQVALYIFLKRNRENDLPHIIKVLSYLISLESNPSLLLFPEGTDLSESNIIKSNKFAQENQLPQYQYVLHPKPSGLVTAVNCLKQCNGGVIHDITIAYEDYNVGERSSEKSFFFGKFSTAVHLHVQRYSLETFPTDKRDIEKWLRNSFDQKEALLKEYYSIGLPSESLNNKKLSHEESLKIHALREQHIQSKWPKKLSLPASRADERLFSFLFMIVLMFIVTYVLFTFLWTRWLAAGIIIVYVSSNIFSGFDNLEMILHSHQIIKTNLNSSTSSSSTTTSSSSKGKED